jgi:chromosome partitioning protein
MRKIAVLNQKGGVGKTTTVANTAAALAQKGCRVVLVDFDPQSHLTIHMGVEPESVEKGSYQIMTGEGKFEDELMLVRPNLWLSPASVNLVGAETELVSVVGRETILREAIAGSEDKFDYMIIDCAPSLGLLTLNALAAAGEVFIPLQPHFLALQGFGKLLQTVDLVNKRINPDLRVKGILLCMFDSRASLPQEVKSDIEEFLEQARGTNCAWSEARILPVAIRRNIKLAEAPSYGQTIFEYAPTCHGAEDYQKVAEFLLDEEGFYNKVEVPQFEQQGQADAAAMDEQLESHLGGKKEDKPIVEIAEIPQNQPSENSVSDDIAQQS